MATRRLKPPSEVERPTQLPRDRRPRFRLPEPVEVDKPAWQGRAWQEMFGALNHLDECIHRVEQRLLEGASLMDRLEAWQLERDNADLVDAAARAERRRLFHYGYLAFDFVDRNGWKLLALAAVVYGFAR